MRRWTRTRASCARFPLRRSEAAVLAEMATAAGNACCCETLLCRQRRVPKAASDFEVTTLLVQRRMAHQAFGSFFRVKRQELPDQTWRESFSVL